jgi:hypothetical protein
MRKRAKGIPHLPPAESPSKLLRRVPEEYPGVLQNIEFFLVHSWREDPTVDDAAVNAVLARALSGDAQDRPAEDPRLAGIAVNLERARIMNEGLAPEAWRDCLLTVKQSVRRHSDCRPGERKYLNFAAPFVP